MLNLMTPERILAAARLIRRGQLYNLAVPLETNGPQHPFFHKTWCITYFMPDATPGQYNFADDVVMMPTHSGTHIDALGHVWRDGTLWNGRSTDQVTSYGVNWGGIHNVRGVVGRGVMVDIPRYQGTEHLELGEVVTVDTIEACAHAQGVKIQPGDILLIRTGWLRVFDTKRELWNAGEPGPDGSCVKWLKERDIMALGADTPGVERYEHRENGGRPVHAAALRDLGVYLIENVNLEELARDRTYEFFFVAAPLSLTKATGSPFSPLALA
jgi:kynurenine formamidase